jgi:hypothetical protein
MSRARPAVSFWNVIDWRLVAACGLPFWAFALGIILSPRTGWIAQTQSPEEPRVVVTDVEEIPMPRAIVVREIEPEGITIPLVIPVPVPGDAIAVAAPVEFRLPASELLPVERCKTFETKVRFHPTMADAADEARKTKKMMFVLHISGDFDDPGFT